MITAIVLLIIAGSSLAAVILTRQWALEDQGVDLERQGMPLAFLDRFTSQQKTVLAILWGPASLVLLVAAAFVLASIVTITLGIS